MSRPSPLHCWLSHPPEESPADYVYRGICPDSGRTLELPRSRLAEAVAGRLMERLQKSSPPEGKMFGVLIVAGPDGPGVLQAYSGTLTSWETSEDWAPGLDEAPPPLSEAPTLRRLEELKQELLQAHGAWSDYQQLRAAHQLEQERFRERLEQAREERARRRRQGQTALELERESQRDSRRKREFRELWTARLAPGRQLEARLEQLRGERRQLSRALQAELHDRFERSLLGGRPELWKRMFPSGPPTGVGECCAPKLLHRAARLGLQPLGMAEFWWGPAQGPHRQGEFSSACQERCQPLLGWLLSQCLAPQLVYVDADLLAAVKPSGLLSVPGRALSGQDCLLHRIRRHYPEALEVHRLDLETSGLLLFARHAAAQAELRAAFARREIAKRYLCLLERIPEPVAGTLDLALAPDPQRPGCYRIDPRGKAARTRYRQLEGNRFELIPETGRSHQLRVHMAQGLGCPILGDPLYGQPAERLRLHAWKLSWTWKGRLLELETPPDF